MRHTSNIRSMKKTPYAYFHGETKETINGQVVKDTELNTEYNGKVLHIDERNNDQFKHLVIDNKHLKKLLSKKASNLNLLDRLESDYSDWYHRPRKSKKKTKKTKKTKKIKRRQKTKRTKK
jgi:hypothetical protein